MLIKNLLLCLTIFAAAIILAGCTRNIRVSTDMQMQNPPEKKIGNRVLIVMSKEQAERVIVEKPGAMSDYFSFEAGKSVKMNLLNMMKALFNEADFANELTSNKNSYDYYILVNFKNHKIEWGASAFSEISMNVYIDYNLINAKNIKLLPVSTDGSSNWQRSGGGVVALINPFVSIGVTDTALGKAWDRAIANSLSQWVMALQGYLNKK